MSAGRTINTQSQSWGTPQKYVDAVKEMFGGHIDLDPCSNEHSIVGANVEYILPEHDGLRESWDYPTIYVNPPYGIDKERGTSIKNWLAKCAFAHDYYDSEVLALVPIAANTTHWKKFVFTKAVSICFLYDTRLRFLENGKDVGKGAPMACAIIYWGRDKKRFYDVFIKHGAVVDISNLIGEKIGADRNKHDLFSWHEETFSTREERA
ncbi:MAG: phage N-6-adenine-methyltransferase [Kiritimatiellaeota bacterium]|nr:phage N-6-adenine-methyltransferase [Kiritimatiellota bacterium]